MAQKSSVYLMPRFPPCLQDQPAGPLASLLEPTIAVSLYFQQETLEHVYFHKYWINNHIFPILFSGAGTFGTTTTVIRTNAVDLSSANATVQNLETLNTTASPNATTNGNTTNNAMFFRQTLFQGTPKNMMFMMVLVFCFF